VAQPSTEPESTALLKEIARRVRQHAETSSCRLNPDERVVAAILKGLVRRRLEFGDYYCPCRPVTGDPEADTANVCPCATHEDEIARTGRCHCGLFVGETKRG